MCPNKETRVLHVRGSARENFIEIHKPFSSRKSKIPHEKIKEPAYLFGSSRTKSKPSTRCFDIPASVNNTFKILWTFPFHFSLTTYSKKGKNISIRIQLHDFVDYRLRCKRKEESREMNKKGSRIWLFEYSYF